jgi:rare lipoprotein A
LSGKHALLRGQLSVIFRKPSVLVAIVTAAVLITVGVIALNASPTQVAASAVADRSTIDDAAANRNLAPIEPSATASPAATPTKKPTTKPKSTSTSTQPPGSGSVVSSGTCQASFYSEGQSTANGEVFDPDAFTAANKTLPFNTRVKVTNLANGKSVVVRINDRGPFVAGRCLDLSRAAFETIASLSSGVATVKYEVLT